MSRRPPSFAPGSQQVGATSDQSSGADEPIALDRTLKASRYAEAELDLGELSLASAGSLEGQLLDSVGEPVPDATLTLRGEGRSLDEEPSPSGRFRFARVPEGTYTLYAESPSAGASSPEQVRIVAGEASTGFELRTEGRYVASEDDVGEGVTTGVAAELRSRSWRSWPCIAKERKRRSSIRRSSAKAPRCWTRC